MKERVMIKTIEHLEANSETIRTILNQWLWVTTEYASVWEWKDVHWWYGERTAIGFLAAAVWKAGGVALEEYRVEKKKSEVVSRGRCDLHFCLGKNASYIAEAKKITVSVTKRPEVAIKEIRIGLDRAFEDANNLTEEENRLGIVFVGFHIGQKSGDCTSLIEKWSKQAANASFYDHAAWIFPKQTRSLGTKGFVPGTAIFIKEARKLLPSTLPACG